jgi:hypothetical protein
MFDLSYVIQQGLNEQIEEQCKTKTNKAKKLIGEVHKCKKMKK